MEKVKQKSFLKNIILWYNERNVMKFKTLTVEQFVEQANKTHKNKYDYSKVSYLHSKKIVEIICLEHGSFFQIPNSHLQGRGCSKCSKKYSPSTEEFIQKAQSIHDGKYDYSKVEYNNNNVKIEIICKKHGSFFQTPSHHLQNHGCPQCGGSNPGSTKEFTKRVKQIHMDKYDYSKVDYINNKVKVELVCPVHGSFFQTPKKHLVGHGCIKCSHLISKVETKWLDEQNVSKEYRQFKINIDKKWFKVDGFNPETNTIYEFFGDYFHGNLKLFKKEDFNQRCRKTFGELYQKTLKRIKTFKENGYNVIYVWEKNYKESL